MLGSLCAETIEPVSEGQNLTAVEGNASVYQVNPVSRISGEGRYDTKRIKHISLAFTVHYFC